MHERIDVGEAAVDDGAVANVADDELGIGRQVLRHAVVNLRVERVEDPHLVPGGEQAVDEMGADEAGTAGDEDAHGFNLTEREVLVRYWRPRR